MNEKIKPVFVIFALLIVAGIAFRFYNLINHTQFEWDQENLLAIPAKEILVNRHFPLIGARTSVGGLFMAPLYSYMAALFYALFGMDPAAGPLLAATIAAVNLLAGFFLLKKYFPLPQALIYALLWSGSVYICLFERNPWNLNLLPPASFFVTTGLFLAGTGRRNEGWFLAGLGLFLGINGHFTVIFLIAVTAVFIFINKNTMDKSIFFLIIPVVFALVPLAVFELRHGFMLSKNLMAFISSSAGGGTDILAKSLGIFRFILVYLGRLFIYRAVWPIQAFMVLIILAGLFYFRNDKKIRLFWKIFLLAFLVYWFGFTLYKGPLSDYYYFGLIPVFIFGVSLLFYKIQLRYFFLTNLIIIIYSIYSLGTLFMMISQNDLHSLAVKKELASTVKKQIGERTVHVNYDMDLSWSFGYNYLWDYYGVQRSDAPDEENTVWISCPAGRFPGKPDYIFGDIALSLPETSRKIYNTRQVGLFKDQYSVRIPRSWQIRECGDGRLIKYLLTSKRLDTCQSDSYNTEGLMAVNIGRCNEKDYRTSGYTVPVYAGKKDMMNVKVIVPGADNGICIGWVSLLNPENNVFTPEMAEIIASLKEK
jgi:hypothetical protein